MTKQQSLPRLEIWTGRCWGGGVALTQLGKHLFKPSQLFFKLDFTPKDIPSEGIRLSPIVAAVLMMRKKLKNGSLLKEMSVNSCRWIEKNPSEDIDNDFHEKLVIEVSFVFLNNNKKSDYWKGP